MKTTIRKITWLFLTTLTLASCSKEDDTPSPKGTNECWYKVTIDGQTILPNRFGQDQIVITGGKDQDSGMEVFALGIDQAKVNTTQTAKLITLVHGFFNSESPLGEYAANSFSSQTFVTSAFEQWPVYWTGDPGDDDYIEDNLTFTLLENSDQRIHMKVSGIAIKIEELEGEIVETGTLPVEAEIIIGRNNYNELQVNGALVGGAVCDCQKQ